MIGLVIGFLCVLAMGSYDKTYITHSPVYEDTYGPYFGNDLDFRIYSDSDGVIEVDPDAAGNTWYFGTGYTDAINVHWYCDTDGDYVLFDEENCTVDFEDVSIHVMDDTTVIFGDDSNGTLQYDEDGEDAMQWNNVAIYGNLRLVEKITTATDLLTVAESGKVIISSYTGSQTLTLPAAAAGLYFTIIDGSSVAADDLAIVPGTGDQIDYDTAGDGIQSVTDAYPQSITLQAIDDICWHTVYVDGTWGQQ